ncbi:unnamed protein product [Lymnaea stagnalis]|uniref:Uncharacterized protein n=1 Tax=Lymnaea stagnalis TaxID=6523 RepID=A0AAV2H1A3_LYMST
MKDLSWGVLAVLVCTVSAVSGQEDSNSRVERDRGVSPKPVKKPCCLPYKFQAITVDLKSFQYDKEQTSRLYRNWESRIQVMDEIKYTEGGIVSTIYRVILDYKNKLRYVIVGDDCKDPVPLNSGMLEPCMPDSARYLGKSYIGAYDNTADFDAWYFRRTDQNRDIEMTIAVTADRCVPVMEHIAGTMARMPTDNLVLFTNVTDVQDDSVFRIPQSCLDKIRM